MVKELVTVKKELLVVRTRLSKASYSAQVYDGNILAYEVYASTSVAVSTKALRWIQNRYTVVTRELVE